MDRESVDVLAQVATHIDQVKAGVSDDLIYTSAHIRHMLDKALRVEVDGKYGKLDFEFDYDDGVLMGVFLNVVDDEGKPFWSRTVAP